MFTPPSGPYKIQRCLFLSAYVINSIFHHKGEKELLRISFFFSVFHSSGSSVVFHENIPYYVIFSMSKTNMHAISPKHLISSIQAGIKWSVLSQVYLILFWTTIIYFPWDAAILKNCWISKKYRNPFFYTIIDQKMRIPWVIWVVSKQSQLSHQWIIHNNDCTMREKNLNNSGWGRPPLPGGPLRKWSQAPLPKETSLSGH